MHLKHPSPPLDERYVPRSRYNPRGLTLIELLIGLSITSVTCGIMAILINATAVGTNTQNDGRRSLVRQQQLKATLEDEFTNTRAILATGTNYVVYWIGDSTTSVVPVNSAVNFSELRLLEIDGTNKLNIYCCKWPAGTTNATILANDVTYAASTDFYAAATALKGTTYFSTNTIATGVQSMSVSLDSGSPTSAKYIHVKIDLSDGTVARQSILGVTLLSPAAPW
jgi:hypothetical protein